jgi:hypothetical protein
MIAGTQLAAQTPTDLIRIRPESSLLRTVVAAAFDRSAIFRSLIDRIDHSDVVVHLTCEQFSSPTLNGRTVLVAATPFVRYLRVQIRCHQPTQLLVGIVAHELQHVVEIASTPRVIDDRSFGALYRTIGFATDEGDRVEQFETTAAQTVGARVQAEFARRPAPVTIAASLERDRPATDALASVPTDGVSAGPRRAAPVVRELRRH